MEPNLVKSLAGLIVAIMTFLGWNTSEYVYLLPSPLRQQIEIGESLEVESQKTEVKEIEGQNQNKISTQPSEKNTEEEIKLAPKKTIQKKSVKKPTPKTNVTIVENKPVPAPTPEVKLQPTYYPAPVEKIKSEIQNIVDQIVPPKTEIEIKKEVVNLSIEDKIKKSVVNIYCSRIVGNRIQKVTGSGVFVDTSGVILTNAHVAEYFLLAQNGNNTNCYIRTGSPAVSSYRAKLVYLPGEWVNANRNNLSLSTLTGTGEHDYALLVITERVRNDAPNTPLTFLNPSDNSLVQNQNIFVAGYPAGFSDVKILDSALYELTKSTTVTNVSSFTGNTVDVINTGPTSVAEHGSSGGAVTTDEGSLAALIVATTIDSQTGGKNIQAITLPYIKRSIKNSSGKSFDSLIANARDEANNFEKTTLPILANTLLGN
jgi:hypothetical protein